MSIQALSASHFLQKSLSLPVFDVRSPGEFKHAHIPRAHSLPLFLDEERAQVGTLYKQRSRQEAIKRGLDFFGPNMRSMVETVEKLAGPTDPLQPRSILVHCWRGGMRSGAVAWLLSLYGYQVFTLKGGYKAFRKEMIDQLEKPWQIRVVGGYTGSGKTEMLEKLDRLGEPVANLEAFANHKGSAFGHLRMNPQPSQEDFENQLGWCLWNLDQKGTNTVWVEDESWRIGSVHIPKPFYDQMRRAVCWFVEIPFEARLDYIQQHYGKASITELIEATMRIQKRLGGLETKTAIQFLVENNTRDAFNILLQYYDKWYLKGLYSKDEGPRDIRKLAVATVSENLGTQALLTAIQTQNEP